MMPREKIAEARGYLPVKRDTFEALIKMIENPKGEQILQPRIEEARYQARFATGTFVDGTATLVVAHPNTKPVALSFDLCSISVRNPRVDPIDASSAVPVGVGPDGRLVAIIPGRAKKNATETSPFHFEWSLDGQRSSSGVNRFSFQVPVCLRNTIDLLIPNQYRLTCDRGQVTDAPESLGISRWTIEAGSASHLSIEVIPRERDDAIDSSSAIFRQRDRIEVSPRGIEATVDLQLEILGERQDQVVLALDPTVRIKSIQRDGESLDWETSPNSKKAVIQFQHVLPIGEHRLRVEYTADLRSGSRDWTLPRVRPQGMKWEQGSAVVTVAHPLQLANLELTDCRQVASVPLSGATEGSRGQQMEFEYHRAEPTIVVRAQTEATRIRSQTGTLVSVSGGDSPPQAIATTLFDSLSGQCFELKGMLGKRWSVQDVASVPESAIEEWSLERPPEKPSDAQNLVIRLAQPLQESEQLTLRVFLNREKAGAPNRLRSRALRVIRFQNVQSDPQLFAVRGIGATLVRPNGGDNVEFLQRERLTTDEEAVLQARRGDLIFRESPGVESMLITMTPGFPEWQADIDVATTLYSDSVGEAFSVRCTTDSTPPDQIVLQTWPRRDQPIRWSLQEDATGADDGSNEKRKLNARQLTDEEALESGFDTECDLWEVQVPNVDAGELRLVGTRRFDLPAGAEAASKVWVASTAAAAAPASNKERVTKQRILEQRVTATLHADPVVRSTWKIKTSLPQVPLVTDDADKRNNAFASYLADATNIKQQVVELSRENTPDASSPAVWISHAQTTAQLSETGAIVCTGVYAIESLGAENVSFQFPEDTVLHRATVEGQPVLISDGLRGSMLEFTLPTGKRFVELAVEYSLTHKPLTPYSRFRWEPPVPTVVELEHRLHLVLPAHFQPSTGRRLGVAQTESTYRLSEWSRRWFGSLSRHSETPTRGGADLSEPIVAVIDDNLLPIERTWIYTVSNGAVETRLFDRQSASALGWGAFLLMALAARTLNVRARKLIAVAAIAAIAIGWLGPAWTPLCRGALWGTMLGLLWRTLPRRLGKAATNRDDSVLVFRRGQTAQSAGAMLLIFSILFGSDTSEGQIGAIEAQPNLQTSEVYRVLFPVDDQGKSNSNFVYVPTKMYDQMVKYAQLRTPTTEQWIVTDARYTGQLVSTGENIPTLDRLDVNLELVTFRPGVSVELNLGSVVPELNQSVVNALEQLRLDGQPLSPQTSDDGRRLLFDVEQVGNHTLAFSLLVQPNPDDVEWDVELPLLKSADTKLDFACDHAELEPRLVTNGSSRPLTRPRQTVEFGYAQLAQSNASAHLRWRKAPSESEDRTSGIRQLSWLSVLPGVARYEVRFQRLDRDGDADGNGELDRLRVAYDSRLRLVPAASPNSNNRNDGGNRGTTPDLGTVDVIESSGSRRVVEVRRNARSTGLGLQFVLTVGMGIGEVELPPIEVLDADVTSEWIANSISPSLLFDRVDREAAAVSLTKFAKAWGMTSEIPAFVVRRESVEGSPDEDARSVATNSTDSFEPWTIKTYPRGSRANADSQTIVTYDHEQTSLRYVANVSTIEGLQFQHRLSAPKKMQVTDIAVEVAGNTVPIHWTQAKDGELRVFIYNPTSGAHRLIVQGTITRPTDADPTAPLPVIHLQDCILNELETQIRRRTTARVTIVDSPALQRSPEGPSANEREDGILVSTLLGDGTAPLTAAVKVIDNRPTINSRLFTTLKQENGIWWSEIKYKCEFQDGTPDQFRFRIPEGWGESMETIPATEWDLIPSAAGELQLVVFPEIPDGATSWQFIMRSPLESNQRPTMPLLFPIGNSETLRWLNVPHRIDGQRVAWDLRGSKPVKAPAAIRARKNTRTYRLVNDRASGELRRIESPSENPLVLAEQISIQIADNGCFGTATWDVDPGGTRTATIIVPRECTLVAVTVDDALAKFVPIIDDEEPLRQFQIELGGMRLSQEVEAVFTSTKTTSPLVAPHLTSDKPHERVWQVSSDSLARPLLFSSGSRRMTPDAFFKFALNSKMRAINSPNQDTSDYSTAELTAWFRRWQKAVYDVSKVAEDDGSPRTNVNDIQQQLQTATYRLGISEEVAQLNAADTRTSRLPAKTLRARVEVRKRATEKRAFLRTAGDEVRFAKPRLGAHVLSRFGFTLVLILLSAAMLRVIALPSWRGVALRWIHGLLALVGFFWIVCLKWPIVGVVLISAAVWWAIAPERWRRPPIRTRRATTG